MADKDSDSISIDDLFAAFGAGPAPISTSSPAKSDDHDAPEDDDQGLDLFAALGLASPQKEEKPAEEEDAQALKNEQLREAQLREQQLMAQQWRRELQQGSPSGLGAPQQFPQVGTTPDQDQQSVMQRSSFSNVLSHSSLSTIQPLSTSTEGDEASDMGSGILSSIKPLDIGVSADQDAEPAVLPLSATIQPLETAGASQSLDSAPRWWQQGSFQVGQLSQLNAPDQPSIASSFDQAMQPVDQGMQASPDLGNLNDSITPAPSVMESLVPDATPAFTQQQPQAMQGALPVQPMQPEFQPQVQSPVQQPFQTQQALPIQPDHVEVIEAADAIVQAPSDGASLDAEAAASRKVKLRTVESVIEPTAGFDAADKQTKRGNILGIVLIAIALLCAVFAFALLTGLIDISGMSGQSQSQNADSPAPASQQAPEEQSSSSSSQVVYSYLIRGAEGTTHEAIETATFGSDGILVESMLEIAVESQEVADQIQEQLYDEFGESVIESSATPEKVTVKLDIARDDLDKDAYTELLSANMVDFKIVQQ